MPIDYTIAAIPTVYGGIRYRSRLEAKWAAFFDVYGWEHEYEPADLGRWSPDFLIRTGHDPILAEVKPITDLDEQVCNKIAHSARDAGFKGSLLLLGTSPFISDEFPGLLAIGWLGSICDPFEGLPVADWFQAVLCRHDGSVDLEGCCPVAEIAGCWNEQMEHPPPEDVRSAWSHACNTVQWRP